MEGGGGGGLGESLFSFISPLSSFAALLATRKGLLAGYSSTISRKKKEIKSLFDQGKLDSEAEIAEILKFIAESEVVKAYHCRELTIKI